MSVAITTEALKSLQELLKAPRRIAITTHHDPDGDAIGSSLGLGAVLEKLGHDVQVVLPNGPPEFLKWMPGYDLVIRHDRDAAAAEAAIGLAILVAYFRNRGSIAVEDINAMKG